MAATGSVQPGETKPEAEHSKQHAADHVADADGTLFSTMRQFAALTRDQRAMTRLGGSAGARE